MLVLFLEPQNGDTQEAGEDADKIDYEEQPVNHRPYLGPFL